MTRVDIDSKSSPLVPETGISHSTPLEASDFVWKLPSDLKVNPTAEVKLATIDAGYCGNCHTPEILLPYMLSQLQSLDRWQSLMYAEKKHSVLMVFQGLDASGKDSAIRHVLSGINPAGYRVVGFKQPTREHLAHDFLWRAHSHVPSTGELVIFNRSHYEDVLVVRVHELVDSQVWDKRYALINDFEQLLVTENRTTILKFFLHISKDEQLARFKHRLDDPANHWKISEADYRERERWDDYMLAFEDMLKKTSTPCAPWFIIPSNNKWFRDVAVAEIIQQAFEALNIQSPEVPVDIERIRSLYHAAETEVQASKIGDLHARNSL